MMKTVSRPQNASTAILTACLNGMTSPFGKFSRVRDRQDQDHQEPEQESRDGTAEKEIGDRDRASAASE